jgi:hypothetical protein
MFRAATFFRSLSICVLTQYFELHLQPGILVKPRRERRRPGRPANGDTAICPQCKTGTIEFNERYRIASDEGMLTEPAWICDAPSCGYVWLVRGSESARRRSAAQS